MLSWPHWFIEILDFSSLYVFLFMLCNKILSSDSETVRNIQFPLQHNSCILPDTYRKSCIFHYRLVICALFITFFHYLVHLITFHYFWLPSLPGKHPENLDGCEIFVQNNPLLVIGNWRIESLLLFKVIVLFSRFLCSFL